MKGCRFFIVKVLALALTFGFILTGCSDDNDNNNNNGNEPGNGDNTAVTFSAVTADGDASTTTTALTLTFSSAITGLSSADITLNGVAGVIKGTLSGSGPVYTLLIEGFAAGGTLTVEVAKWNYDITVTGGSPITVTIHHEDDT